MEIYGETMETVKDFIFLGSKISADSDCSHEIKKCCSWKKSYDHTMRHYFANKACSSQSYVFLGSKITADYDCNHEIKRLLILGRKVMPI